VADSPANTETSLLALSPSRHQFFGLLWFGEGLQVVVAHDFGVAELKKKRSYVAVVQFSQQHIVSL
jgi:hypothetical protein